MTKRISMFEPWKRFDSWVPLGPHEWEVAFSRMRHVVVKQREAFLQPGDDAQQVAWVKTGLFKVARFTASGTESIKNFCAEGDFLSAFAEMLEGSKSRSRIEALEDSELLVFDVALLEELEKRHAGWRRLYQRLLERQYLLKERREQAFLECNALERWQGFQTEYPHLTGRVTQRDIAAFLGVTAVTLSRVVSGRRDRR